MEPTLTGGELRKGGKKKVTSRWLEKKKHQSFSLERTAVAAAGRVVSVGGIGGLLVAGTGVAQQWEGSARWPHRKHHSCAGCLRSCPSS